MIFIDGSNFYHGLKNNLGKFDIDFQKFSLAVTGNRRFVWTHYYNAPLDRLADPEIITKTISKKAAAFVKNRASKNLMILFKVPVLSQSSPEFPPAFPDSVKPPSLIS